MPLGTPEQYSQAIAAEHQELPRDYVGRDGHLDIVQVCEDILLIADLVESPTGKEKATEEAGQPEPLSSSGEWKDDRHRTLSQIGSLFGQMLRYTGIVLRSTSQSTPRFLTSGRDIGPGLH